MIISKNTIKASDKFQHLLMKIRTTIQQAKDLPQSIKAIYKKPRANVILNMVKD